MLVEVGTDDVLGIFGARALRQIWCPGTPVLFPFSRLRGAEVHPAHHRQRHARRRLRRRPAGPAQREDHAQRHGRRAGLRALRRLPGPSEEQRARPEDVLVVLRGESATGLAVAENEAHRRKEKVVHALRYQCFHTDAPRCALAPSGARGRERARGREGHAREPARGRRAHRGQRARRHVPGAEGTRPECGAEGVLRTVPGCAGRSQKSFSVRSNTLRIASGSARHFEKCLLQAQRSVLRRGRRPVGRCEEC